MENKIEQLWMNSEAGLLYKTYFIPSTDTLVGCVGKKVVIESCEMDTVCIEGKYYDVIGNLHGLDLIREIPDSPIKQNHNMSPRNKHVDIMIENCRQVRDIIEELYPEDENRFDPEVTCSGWLYNCVLGDKTPAEGVATFMRGFCNCGEDCGPCDLYRKLESIFGEVE